jgi:hypothetical protein
VWDRRSAAKPSRADRDYTTTARGAVIVSSATIRAGRMRLPTGLFRRIAFLAVTLLLATGADAGTWDNNTTFK